MANMTHSNSDYLPWSWTITSLDKSAHSCPSESSILGTFAAVNAIVSALGVLFGHRTVARRVTCGLSPGHKFDESTSWKYRWILTVGLQLGANAIIAALIKKMPGYAADYSVGQMTIFLMARPRLGWIMLGLAAQYPGPSPFSYPWGSAFMTQFLAECGLQLISLYIMGKTAHFAASRGYYDVHQESYHNVPSAARLMYSGALYYLVTGIISLIIAVGLISHATSYTDRGKLVVETEWAKKHPKGLLFALSLLLASTWMGGWIFWAAFVHLAGDLYCPPRLIEQGVIWTVFSIVGILLGAGV